MGDSQAEDPQNTRTLTLVTDGGALVERTIELKVLEGPDVGLACRITSGRAILGCSEDAGLKLSDPTVSRRHAELRVLSDGVLLLDLDSKNGTKVSGASIREALLQPGDEFSLGETKVLVVERLEAVEAPPSDQVRFGEYLTANRALGHSLQILRRAADSTATILIEGDTGTGKELLARAIHAHSARSAQPLLVVDCSAVAASLLESQLFGHKKGAFTGALADQLGAFEAAGAGTVFLDELGELPLDLQPKLLRVLESRTVRRLGENEDRTVDVRFVAATNRDLKALVASGAFRSDLYYRVAVVRVRIPPLSERVEDIPLLGRHLVLELSSGTVQLAPSAFATLAQYNWPGNVRELRNVLHRALAVSKKSVLEPADLFPDEEPARAQSFHEAKDDLIASFERRYVRALLDRHPGNVSRAAKEANLSRNALYALMKRAKVDEEP